LFPCLIQHFHSGFSYMSRFRLLIAIAGFFEGLSDASGSVVWPALSPALFDCIADLAYHLST
jgi:hypothetical protein